MKKINATYIAVCLAIASSNVLADTENSYANFNYDYFQAGVGVNPLSYSAEFSKTIFPNAHILLDATSSFSSDYNLGMGVGFQAPLSNWTDITGGISGRFLKYGDPDDQYSDFNNKYPNEHKFGIDVNIGLRQWLGPQVEVGSAVGNVHTTDGNELYGNAYISFHATKDFSFGVKGTLNDVLYDNQATIFTQFRF